MATKICKVCLCEKEESEFNVNHTKKDGSKTLKPLCKKCDYQRKYGYIKKYSREYYKENKEAVSKRHARYVAKVKQETVSAYGKVCACCGEKRIEFLCIDHIKNDGAERRKSGEHKLGTAFYSQLRRGGFPDYGLQVLCYNCNQAKQLYGKCPHGDENGH